MTLSNFRGGLAAVLVVTLAGCGTQTTTPGADVLRFLTASLPAATAGDEYRQDINLTSGTRPYSVRLVKGSLPAGLRQADRTITGTPTTAGTFTFTLEASDANLSVVDKDFTLIVTPAPSRKLEWTLPPTAVSGDVSIPFVLRAAKNVTSVRAAIPLPAGAIVISVTPRDLKPLLVWRLRAGILRVDAAPSQVQSKSGDVTLFTVTVRLPASIRLSGVVGYEVRVSGKPTTTAAMVAATPQAAPASPTPSTTPASPAGPTPTAVPPAGSTPTAVPPAVDPTTTPPSEIPGSAPTTPAQNGALPAAPPDGQPAAPGGQNP